MCEPKTAATNGQPTPTLERTPHDIFVGAGLALAGGVFWGVNATVSKLLMNDYHADPLWIACVRELLAGVVFLVCAGIFTPDKFINSLKDYRSYPRLLLCAFFCVLMVQVSYLKAIDWTNSGTATVLQTLNLLVVLVFVCIMGKRLPGKQMCIRDSGRRRPTSSARFTDSPLWAGILRPDLAARLPGTLRKRKRCVRDSVCYSRTKWPPTCPLTGN